MTSVLRVRLAGLLCLAGGLLTLVISVALNSLLEPLNTMFAPATLLLVRAIVWGIVGLYVAGGSLGVLALNAAEAGWQYVLGVTGAAIRLLGLTAFIIGGVYLVDDILFRLFYQAGRSKAPYMVGEYLNLF